MTAVNKKPGKEGKLTFSPGVVDRLSNQIALLTDANKYMNKQRGIEGATLSMHRFDMILFPKFFG